MTSFYFLSEKIRVLVCMLSIACVGVQTGALVYMVIRSTKKDKRHTVSYISQIAVTAQSIVMLMLISRVQLNAAELLPAGSEYVALRCIAFAAVAASCAAVIIFCRVFDPLLCAAVSAVTLPFVERLPYAAVAVLFAAAEVLLIVRAVHLMAVCRRDIRNELSRDSVKLAVDELHSGILFCERDGNILLVNNRMQRLMKALCGEVCRDGKEFYERLMRGDVLNGSAEAYIGEKPVFVLPDGRVWLFAKCGIDVDSKHFTQVSAADITAQWRLTNELNEQRRMLQSRGLELQRMISDIRYLCREEEMLKIRSRFHDVLGQRLALLFRSLREGKEPDEELIRKFASDLPDELSEREPVVTAEDRLDTLRALMKEIGVKLCVEGRLPSNENHAWLGMDIITEAVTNSVRHGLASEIYICLERRGGDFSMRITDNGIPPKPDFTEGGGLGTIRKKVGFFDGRVTVEATPRFILSVYIPGGEAL